MIKNKCFGANNSKFFHFRGSCISYFLKTYSLPIGTHFLQHSIVNLKAAANTSLVMVLTTPYKLFLKVLEARMQPTRSDFFLEKSKYTAWAVSIKIGWLGYHLDAFCHPKLWESGSRGHWCSVPNKRTITGTTQWASFA